MSGATQPPKLARFVQDSQLPPGYAVLDSLPYPVILLDADTCFYWVNHAAESFFQRSNAILVGSHLNALLPADNTIFQLLRRVQSYGNSISDQNIELVSPRVGRHLVDVQISVVDGQTTLFCLSLQPRALAERVRGMSSFKGAALSMSKISALLAHEIKNPLAGIKGAAQLLQMELPKSGQELSELIVEEADRITRLLNRIEGMASDAPVATSELNIHEVLDHSIRITKASFGRHIDIITQYDPSLPSIMADREMLIQAFLNILKNASEAVGSNGKISVTTSYSLHAYFAAIGGKKSAHLPLQIEIADNGSGIPSELQDLIFEPFISSKSDGSGLGLAMVASVISDHGGMVSANSRSGETVITLNLPLQISRHNQQQHNTFDGDLG